MVRPRVFFDFSVNNISSGRVVFELFVESAPKTCENFRALCTGEKGLSPLSNTPLYYKNSIVHRSIQDFMLQGGDFTKRNGTGGESIYGGTFADEDLSRPLDKEGLLCMANKGPGTNGSQFFITLRESPHLNGKHVVFGKVIKGYDEVIKKLAEVAVDEKDRPVIPIVISNCGELELKQKKAVTPAGHVRERSSRRRTRRSSSPDEEQSHRKKIKYKEHSVIKTDGTISQQVEHQETEEAYDARLEKEELERLEMERTRILEYVHDRYRSNEEPQGVIRFKGRGKMKYIDPETTQGRHPA